MGVVLSGVVAFTAIVLLLVAVILSAKALLIPSGNVTININGDASKAVSVPTGGKLLQTLFKTSQVFIDGEIHIGLTQAQIIVQI